MHSVVLAAIDVAVVAALLVVQAVVSDIYSAFLFVAVGGALLAVAALLAVQSVVSDIPAAFLVVGALVVVHSYPFLLQLALVAILAVGSHHRFPAAAPLIALGC